MNELPKPPSFRLDGRRALVTGASSGIGLGCAVALGHAGAHVVMAARDEEKLDEACRALSEQGTSCEALPLDVVDIEAVHQAVGERGPIDILVNSAGAARHSPALETSPEDYDAVMNVNLRAAYFLSAAVAKRLIEEGRNGSIVHISSQMAHVGGIDRAVYCASKHGIEGFVKSMAMEWGPHGIRINSICPTFIRTPLTAPTFAKPDRVAWITDKIKLGRIGEVEDIMGAAVYLASDASAMITGTSLVIDGGWTAG